MGVADPPIVADSAVCGSSGFVERALCGFLRSVGRISLAAEVLVFGRGFKDMPVSPLMPQAEQ